jgi:endogenous inhibitor of DNA gyrase (YacG/DUF329 family)
MVWNENKVRGKCPVCGKDFEGNKFKIEYTKILFTADGGRATKSKIIHFCSSECKWKDFRDDK